MSKTRSRDRAEQGVATAEIHKNVTDVAKHVTDVANHVTDVAKNLTQIHHALEEVVEDNVALARSVKSIGDGHEALRLVLCRELDLLRSDVSAELLSQALRNYCRELAPVLNALERMLTDADLGDAVTTRLHLESLTTTLQAALFRMTIERLPVTAGTDMFDARVHDCVRICTPADSPIPGASHGSIVFVQEHGYCVRGKVAQPAKVWVQHIAQDSPAS